MILRIASASAEVSVAAAPRPASLSPRRWLASGMIVLLHRIVFGMENGQEDKRLREDSRPRDANLRDVSMHPLFFHRAALVFGFGFIIARP